MEATIPYHRRSNNTSTAPETTTEEKKISGPEGMIPTYPLETIETKECLTGTMEVKSRPPPPPPPPSKGKRGTILGAVVPEHPTRAQPHERGGKSSSLGLHGRSSTTNGIPVYGRGVTFPSPNKV